MISTKRFIAPITGLVFLVLILFGCGFILGTTGRLLLTGPKLLGIVDLAAIPAAVVTVVILFRLSLQLFKPGVNEERPKLFSLHGFAAWAAFLLSLSAFVAGIRISVAAINRGRDQRETRQVQNPAPPAREPETNAATPPVRGQVPRLSALHQDATMPFAILDSERAGIGDQVGEWVVIAIGPKSVTLRNSGGETNVLWLK